MIMFRLGRWSHETARFFIYTRVYWKGRWTPLCKMRVHWVNVLSDLIRVFECDLRQAILTRLYARLERYRQPVPRPGRYERSIQARYRDGRP